jgi:hypothetical protein
MNERIEELAEKAGSTHKLSLGVYQFYADELENFAESIIDECCFKLLMMDAKAQGMHNYYKHAALELKRNFGVKNDN